MKSKKEQFIQLCNTFESYMRTKYQLKDHDSAYFYFANRSEYARYKEEIHVIRIIRNMLQHNNTSISGVECIELSDILIETLKDIIAFVEKPRRVKDYMITHIYSATMNSSEYSVVKAMKEKHISHVPVLDEEHRLLGVFSENTIFERLPQENTISLDRNDTMYAYRNYLPIQKHANESYAFIKEEEDIEVAKAMFGKDRKDKKRVAMLFVSKEGKEDAKLTGLLTPWDIVDE